MGDDVEIYRAQQLASNLRVLALAFYLPTVREGGLVDQHTSWVLRLKKLEPAAVEHFYQLVAPLLTGARFAVAAAPRHDPAARAGCQLLAARLGSRRVDASSVLVRRALTPKASSGVRDYWLQRDSLVVERPHLVVGRPVLLLDDVQSTGRTLMACADLLLHAGASYVQCLVLGQTYNYSPVLPDRAVILGDVPGFARYSQLSA